MTKDAQKTGSRTQRLGKMTSGHFTAVRMAIFALVALQFVSQFVLFRERESPGKANISRVENVMQREVKPEPEEKKPEIVTVAENPPPVVRDEEKAEPKRGGVKKKPSRESKAERLRRAERILTGV